MPMQCCFRVSTSKMEEKERRKSGLWMLFISILISTVKADLMQAPRFITQPSNSGNIVPEGRIKILQCQALGYPQPKYMWLKDGQPLGDFSTELFYRILSTRREDAGSYQCIAKNDAGSIFSQKADVSVAYMGAFEDISEQILSVPSGAAAVLEFPPIESNPQPTVMWLSDGGQLPYDRKYAVTTNHQLIVLSAAASDQRAYRVRATNTQIGKEEISGFTRLSVGEDDQREIAPEIIVPPQDVNAVKGGFIPHDLQCIANARPLHELETIWLKDNIVIENAGISYQFNDPWNNTLSLLSLNLTHTGRYTCQVRLRSGGFPIVSASANVVVLEKPTFTAQMRAETIGEYGSQQIIPCEAAGLPTPNITWYRNTVPLQEGKQYSVQEDGSLVIRRLGIEDTGMFQCVAANEAGEDSLYTWLKVKTAAPVLVSPPVNVTVLDGKDATISCRGLGAPAPNITWIYQDSGLVDLSARVQVLENGDLLLADTRESDAGKYTCVRANEAGSVQGSAFLSILGKRRIYLVDVHYLFRQLQETYSHGSCDCSFRDMVIIKESKRGLLNAWTFRCNMCKLEQTVKSEKTEGYNSSNFKVANAAIGAGIHFTQAMDFLSGMDITPLSINTFQKGYEVVSRQLMKTTEESLELAAGEEWRLAEKEGCVDDDGVANVTVEVDGAWCSRSYQGHYKSLAGFACIIGERTGKVLDYGVKNRYCVLCERAEKKRLKLGQEVSPKSHICYKNWSLPPNGMEAAILAECFTRSVEKYKLRYVKFIGDGDSSTYKTVLDAEPYGPSIIPKKLECVIHISRVFYRKLRELGKKKQHPKELRDFIKSKKFIKELRQKISEASSYFREDDSKSDDAKSINLQRCLLSVLRHCLGNHMLCSAAVSCECDGGDWNSLWTTKAGVIFFAEISTAFARVVTNAASLLENKTTNKAESFNSILNRYNLAKRVMNYQRNGYNVRAAAAIIQKNSRGHFIGESTLALTGRSPSSAIKINERRKLKKRKARTNVLDEPTSKRRRLFFYKNDQYGAPKEDLASRGFPLLTKEDMLKSIENNAVGFQQLEIRTRLQALIPEWHCERKKRLTASNFGPVICATKRKNMNKFVQSIHKGAPSTAAITWGRDNEEVARLAYEYATGSKVQRSGLVVRSDYPFLAASPDGVIGDNMLLEIKCPYSAIGISTPEEAITSGKLKYLKISDEGLIFNKKDRYYHQVQGQLFMTKKKTCHFFIWTPMWTLCLQVDSDAQWRKNIPKLQSFYFDHYLPSICQPIF